MPGRVPLPHPRRRLRDQHVVVTFYTTPCICAQYGAYAVRAGIEPTNAALALPNGISPPEGRARLSFAFSYLLVLVQQSRQPIRFLYARVQLSIFLGKVISLSLCGRDAHGANKLDLRTSRAALRR